MWESFGVRRGKERQTPKEKRVTRLKRMLVLARQAREHKRGWQRERVGSMPGAMRRRVLAGLKEVGQAVRSGRAKCVVLAPKVEEVPGRGEDRVRGGLGKGRISVVRESSVQVRGD
ncbi:unnamed protein product [Closterium sp. Naga37s-1]|nr:unnamed protein product [Closterium sp. Naga37s-1]